MMTYDAYRDCTGVELLDIIEDLEVDIYQLTAKLETVTMERDELKKKLESYETGTGHRNQYFTHDHLASSNS